MGVICKNCGGAHPAWDCSKPKATAKSEPEQLVQTHRPEPAPSKALFDRSAYQRQYMADLRTIKRLGLEMTVAEWRKTK